MPRELVIAQLSRHLRAFAASTAAAAALCLPVLGCESTSSNGGGHPETPDASQPLVLDLSGQVLSTAGDPVANVEVWVAHHESVTSGPDGRFAIPNVQAPYALAARSSHVVKVLDALTTASPVVTFDATGQHSSQLAGSLQGFDPQGSFPALSVMLSYSSACPVLHERSDVAASGAYDASFIWFCAKSALTGTLDALVYTADPETAAVRYHSYGQREALTLADRASLDDIDVPMQPVEARTLTATALVPAGMEPNDSSSGGLVREGRRLIPYGTLTWDGTSGEVRAPLPALAGWAPFLSLKAAPSVGAVAYTVLNWTGAADQTALATPLTFLGVPRQRAPENAATNVPARQGTLAWEMDDAELAAGAERVFLVVLRPSAAGRDRIEISTPNRSIDLAALASLPVNVDSGAKYSWTVEAFERRGEEVLRTSRSDLSTFTTAH